MGVTLSHPDKALWQAEGDVAAVTKLDLARYYEAVGGWMLPHLQGRPCSLVRAPDGLPGEQFFQRHAMAGMSPLFELVKVRGDKSPYVQIDRVEALAAVAQIAGLEITSLELRARASRKSPDGWYSTWTRRRTSPFERVIEAAQEIRRRLEALGLHAFCKTTGGKGLHVVTPLLGGKQGLKWPAGKDFAHLVCAQMVHDSPSKYLDTMSKAQRAGKIFLDYLRNDRTSTAVAVLSSRARAGAPVSMPVAWAQVRKGLASRRFTVRTAAKLLKSGRGWDDYGMAAGSLPAAIKKLTHQA